MNVLVSIPNKCWVHKHVMFAAFRISQDSRYRVELIAPTWVPYEHAMNRIAKDFIAGTYDYWLNMDADNPPLANPLDRIGSDYDVIGFPTPVWHDGCKGLPFYWNAMDAKDDGYIPAVLAGQDLVEVDAVGSGCVLFNRPVVEAVRKEFGPPFVRTYDEDGLVEFGPDFYFCKRAKELGYHIAADPVRVCNHFVEIDMFELTQRMSSRG